MKTNSNQIMIDHKHCKQINSLEFGLKGKLVKSFKNSYSSFGVMNTKNGGEISPLKSQCIGTARAGVTPPMAQIVYLPG